MNKYETQFGIKMEAGEIYNYAAQFFPILGYRFVSGDKPNTISFTRGERSTFSCKIEKQKCDMAMSLISSGEETIVKFYFAFATELLLIGSGDLAKLDLEVERFRSFLLGSGGNAEKCIDVSQKKIISEDLSGLKSKPAYYLGTGSLIFGITILILGILVYLYTQPAIAQYESLLGTIGRDIGSAFGYTRLEQEYQILKLLNVGSFIAMIIGVISVIIGLIGKRE